MGFVNGNLVVTPSAVPELSAVRVPFETAGPVLDAPAGGRVRVRGVQLDDLPAIWRFCAESYDVYRGCSFEDFRSVWHHRWLHNPAAAPGQPLGWLLENDASQVVGFYGVVPVRLRIGGRAVTAFSGSNWIVHPDYRRHKLKEGNGAESGSQALFREYMALGAQNVLVSTGVAPAAATARERVMKRIPVEGIDRSMWWIIDPKRFLALKVAQLGAKSAIWKAVASAAPALNMLGPLWPIALGIYTDPKHRIRPWLSPARIEFDCPELPVERVTSFRHEFDAFWAEHRESYDVTTERSSAFLRWRHCMLPESVGQSFVFACRDHGRLLGYVALQTPGTRSDTVLRGSYTVTDLFYPPGREDVLGNLMNAAFRFVVEQNGTVLKASGFHPVVQAALASQRPHVIEPDALQNLARGRALRLLAARSLRKGHNTATEPKPKGSYWYKVPTRDLAETCESGSWWPAAIDGTSTL
ncbi:MAG TPA: hypothetical protein VHL31_22570 [Geminicoccus sp.]|jgi:hypothetical protein|uniref:hypothetical protein n=1 Tax=Geminicoccus sp. TaxID=2024832 RepID=UPI002E345F12|nr:hypothetical protein [Geminicoccus sp.]HEX2529066.1 hypothetical protein [Geminicoccus sp.]